MSKHIKKLLVSASAILMFAGVGAGFSNLTANGASLGLDQYPSSWEKRAGITHWGVNGYAYIRHGMPAVKYHAKTFRRGHHSYKVRDAFNTPGTIIGMDGNTHVSNYKVLHSLEGRHVSDYRIVKGHPNMVVTRHHAKRHIRRHRAKRHNYRRIKRSRRHNSKRRR